MSVATPPRVRLVAPDGRQLTLGALVKSGGAGSVHRVRELPGEVAKLYHPHVDRAQYERKVAAMLTFAPDLPDLVDGDHRYVQIAWPKAMLRDERGRFIGFTMPLLDVDATSELEVILQERQARAAKLPTGLGAKATLAANLAGVVAALHRQQHYVVDLKPVNLRFYRQSLYMAMLDCDGFSIHGEGGRHEAPQVTPDYLAPEFQRDGAATLVEEDQDRFALAVVVFQLLNFGIHPYTGRPASPAVPTDIPGRIAGRYYAYGMRKHDGISPNPASGHAQLPTTLRLLFDRAFEGPGSSRPSAREWADALQACARRSGGLLLVCRKDPSHQHFAGYACAACARAALIADAKRAAASRPRPVPSQPGRSAPPTRARSRPQSPFPARGAAIPSATRRAYRSPPPPPPRPLFSLSAYGKFRLVMVVFGLLFAVLQGAFERKRSSAPPRPSATHAMSYIERGLDEGRLRYATAEDIEAFRVAYMRRHGGNFPKLAPKTLRRYRPIVIVGEHSFVHDDGAGTMFLLAPGAPTPQETHRAWFVLDIARGECRGQLCWTVLRLEETP